MVFELIPSPYNWEGPVPVDTVKLLSLQIVETAQIPYLGAASSVPGFCKDQYISHPPTAEFSFNCIPTARSFQLVGSKIDSNFTDGGITSDRYRQVRMKSGPAMVYMLNLLVYGNRGSLGNPPSGKTQGGQSAWSTDRLAKRLWPGRASRLL